VFAPAQLAVVVFEVSTEGVEQKDIGSIWREWLLTPLANQPRRPTPAAFNTWVS
jgi:hypothetical protein